MSAGDSERSYRLEPLDTSGAVLGLGVVQATLVGLALTLAAVALSRGTPLPVAAAPLVLAGVVGFARVEGHLVWEWVPLCVGWAMRLASGRRWHAPLSLWPVEGDTAGPLPPCLSGLDIVEVPWHDDRELGVVRDRRRHTLTAVIPVGAAAFTLEAHGDQDRLLAGWGDVLNQFVKGRSPVAHVSWSDLTRPSGLGLPGRALTLDDAGGVDAERSYRGLQELIAASASSHEVVVGVTVARALLHARRALVSATGHDLLADALVGAVDALDRGLRSAGQHAGDPLDPAGLRALLRTRVDPASAGRHRGRGRLADRLGYVASAAAGPLVMEPGWRNVRIDAAWHRTYWVAGWPQLALPPSWIEPFLAAGGATRSMTVYLVPVDGRDSRRRISRDLVKLESDAATKEDRGRRVDARHHRLTDSLLEREHELAAGYTEFAYVGLVTISARSRDELDDVAEIVEQRASDAGMDLRPLDGRQDVAWAAALPFGLAPSTLLAT